MQAAFYLLFGATFLPGLLSDSFDFDPRTAYSLDKPFSETEGLYEVVPLKREKRQVQVTAPVPSNQNPVLSTIWANKTRDLPSSGPTNQGTDKPLLRNSVNHFTPNGASDIGNGNVTSTMDEQLPEFPDNVTNVATDHNLTIQSGDFLYYSTKYYPPPEGKGFWVDLGEINKTRHELLSSSHRRAATLKPMFDFVFYGHKITNITVATGGFIYLGDQVHAWLAATQYVAPLMANFDSSNSPNSTVSYYSGDFSFTVEWSNLQLHDAPDKGNFTFQATLYKNGTIVFAYQQIPIPITLINDTHHPVKVGLSDAYIRDRAILVVKQKTIYEYDRLDVKDAPGYQIINGAAIVFQLRQTCLNLTTCEECTAPGKTNFTCLWCPKLNRCSSGVDRHRQEWIHANCEKVSINSTDQCSGITYNYSNTTPISRHQDLDHEDHEDHDHHDHEDLAQPETSEVTKSRTSDAGGTSAGGALGIMFLLVLIFGGAGWLTYAYFYPHSPSGQLLIRWRPAAWGLRRGEARYSYTAAIHM